jgi:hypothetical protein
LKAELKGVLKRLSKSIRCADEKKQNNQKLLPTLILAIHIRNIQIQDPGPSTINTTAAITQHQAKEQKLNIF